MQQLTEIRWHARAGQGAVTAAKVVAETALSADQYMQAMPEYGPERMGAPIKAFTRISDEPIEIHNNIENPRRRHRARRVAHRRRRRDRGHRR